MAFQLEWSPTARLDFWDILSYIADSNRPAAARFGQRLLDAIEQIQESPESGRMVPEFNDPAVREVVRKPCRIIYRVNRTQEIIEIARIWHAARGAPNI